MIIPLTDEYRIKTDSMNWTLEQMQASTKSAAMRWVTVGHWGSLGQALEAIPCHIGRKLNELNGLEELRREMRELAEEIRQRLDLGGE